MTFAQFRNWWNNNSQEWRVKTMRQFYIGLIPTDYGPKNVRAMAEMPAEDLPLDLVWAMSKEFAPFPAEHGPVYSVYAEVNPSPLAEFTHVEKHKVARWCMDMFDLYNTVPGELVLKIKRLGQEGIDPDIPE